MSLRTSEVCWVPLSDPGFEHLRLRQSEVESEANGAIVRVLDGKALRIGYSIQVDAAWCLRRAEIVIEGGARLLLEADGAGSWTMNGIAAPQFEGCYEIDIQVTPFTNTLPIRRLPFVGDSPIDIRVVYLPLPSLEPRVAEQRYRRLGEGRYLYEGLFRDFKAELPVDDDGLVRDYPETFRRVFP